LWKLERSTTVPRMETAGQPFRQYRSLFLSKLEMLPKSQTQIAARWQHSRRTESNGLSPPSGILNTRKHNVSETGPLSALRRGTYYVGSFRKS
jgi:hypothetical protein